MKSCSGTLLAFLAWLLVAPADVVADCSPHAKPGIATTPGSASSLDMLDLAGTLAVADIAEAPGMPKPCTGALCSNRPTSPVLPAPSQVVRIGLWAMLEVAPAIAPPGRADSRSDDGQDRPILRPTSIFHPPRPSPSPSTS